MRIASTKPARIEFFALAAFSWKGTSPSTRTCRRGKAPSPWDASLPSVAGRRDNFCATSLDQPFSTNRLHAGGHVKLTNHCVEFFPPLKRCEERERFSVSCYRSR